MKSPLEMVAVQACLIGHGGTIRGLGCLSESVRESEIERALE